MKLQWILFWNIAWLKYLNNIVHVYLEVKCCYNIKVINTKVLWSSSWTHILLWRIQQHHVNRIIHCVIVFLSFVYQWYHILCATWQVFLEKQRMLSLPVHLVHASSLYWNLGCSFTFVSLCCLGYFMFFVVCFYFPCLVVVLGLYSFDYHLNLGSFYFPKSREWSWNGLSRPMMWLTCIIELMLHLQFYRSISPCIYILYLVMKEHNNFSCKTIQKFRFHLTYKSL